MGILFDMKMNNNNNNNTILFFVLYKHIAHIYIQI